MQKQNLTQASRELFRRAADERFASLDDLWRHCQDFKERSTDRWHSPAEILTAPMSNRLDLKLGGDSESYRLNDWSFSQLCKLAGVSKDTVNKVSADTAGRVLAETFPQGGKPMQVLTLDRAVRSIHGASYTRLHNLDLLAIVKEFATEFQPPQTGMNGATGLYCGEQDMFVFLVDPTGWAEIEGEAFAPGFFLWNSEVGRRSVGVQTFWFQAVCQNHIVWDAVEVVDFSRNQRVQLTDDEQRYQSLLKDGVEALSQYDREIAHGGNDELAWASAIALKFNHISGGRGRILWLQQQLGIPAEMRRPAQEPPYPLSTRAAGS